MKLTSEQAGAITSAVWLIGLGLLITTGRWWPGILVLLGVSSIVQGFVKGRGWFSSQGALWMIGLSIWVMFGHGLLVLLTMIALSGLFGAFFKPSPFDRKPKSDPSLADDGF